MIHPDDPTLGNPEGLHPRDTTDNVVESTKQQSRPLSAYTKGTYYKEEYGMRIKVILDGILKDKQDRLFPYSKFKLKAQSLKLFVLHSWSWLVDVYDKKQGNNTYGVLRELCSVSERPEGIAISWKIACDDLENIVQTKAPLMAEDETNKSGRRLYKAPWKAKLQAYLENPGDVDFELDRLALSEEEVQWIDTIMVNFLEDFSYKVSMDRNILVVLRK